MKIVKWVCGILLLLSGAGLVFVGAAGSWEGLTSGQPVGLILMLHTAALGVGLIWLGVRLLRGRPGKKAQEQVPSDQEKTEEEVRKKAVWEAQERQRQEEQRWLEERPALKAQFACFSERSKIEQNTNKGQFQIQLPWFTSESKEKPPISFEIGGFYGCGDRI